MLIVNIEPLPEYGIEDKSSGDVSGFEVTTETEKNVNFKLHSKKVLF